MAGVWGGREAGVWGWGLDGWTEGVVDGRRHRGGAGERWVF